MMAMYVFMTAPRAAACAERIQAVLDTDPAVADPWGRPATAAAPAARRRGSTAGRRPSHGTAANTVEFRGVSFAYPGAEAPVLDGITFTAAPGTTTAVIGATGSGKTTLLNLLPRFLDATGGEISIGGRDIRGLPLESLRSLIALVPQQSYLFSGTLAENLRMGSPEASDDGTLAGAEDGPGRGLRPQAAARAPVAREPGRHQLLRRPAAAAVHRPGPAPGRPGLPVRRQFLRPGLRHGRQAPRRPSNRCCAPPPS